MVREVGSIDGSSGESREVGSGNNNENENMETMAAGKNSLW